MMNFFEIELKERHWLFQGQCFEQLNLSTCPYCSSNKIEILGTIDTPPLFVQIQNPDWEQKKYRSNRYFCSECQNLCDVLIESDLEWK